MSTAVGGVTANASMTRRATDGDNSASPSATSAGEPGVRLGLCALLLLAALVAVLISPHQPAALLGGLALAWADRTQGSRK
ncbi:hypothetical protein ACWDRB_03450 [Nonomuraea sp. NPDC003707]